MAAVAMTEMQKTGKVTQVIGPVVDVEFPPGALPEIYTALTLSNPGISGDPDNLTVEVSQHLGENMAWLYRFTLSLLKQHPGRQSLVMKRRCCGWDENFLLEVLAGAKI